MNTQKELTSFEKHIEMVEDNYGDEYESTYAAAGHFGTSQTNILMMAILKQMKEMNRLMYNHWEARQ